MIKEQPVEIKTQILYVSLFVGIIHLMVGISSMLGTIGLFLSLIMGAMMYIPFSYVGKGGNGVTMGVLGINGGLLTVALAYFELRTKVTFIDDDGTIEIVTVIITSAIFWGIVLNYFIKKWSNEWNEQIKRKTHSSSPI